jgi:hypothetical protein
MRVIVAVASLLCSRLDSLSPAPVAGRDQQTGNRSARTRTYERRLRGSLLRLPLRWFLVPGLRRGLIALKRGQRRRPGSTARLRSRRGHGCSTAVP